MTPQIFFSVYYIYLPLVVMYRSICKVFPSRNKIGNHTWVSHWASKQVLIYVCMLIETQTHTDTPD